MSYRMQAACNDCPFNEEGEGRHLRDSLQPGRWRGILYGLRRDEHFLCHKTVKDAGDGSELICAGSIAWQEERGLSSQYLRVCERLEWIGNREKAAR